MTRLLPFLHALHNVRPHARERTSEAAATRDHVRRDALGYLLAVLGVAGASLVIAVVQRFVHVSNISLLYLFVVLALARQFGRWPAVLASLLAFLAYDFLFIPPLYHFTVDDPAGWVSLAALLVTALVLGELTAMAEARRREAIHAEALRESDKLKTALLGSVTHDLRTPLAAIKAATGSLLEQGASWSTDDWREMLDTIDESCDRLDRLVSNLLDLSRLEGGAATPEKDWYPIGDVLSTVLDQLDLTGQTRNHRFEIDVPADLPLVAVDYPQMEEVFTNLLENAMKYSPAGSLIRVQARAVPTAGLEVRVTDQGIGIPASELQAIFDKFYRVQQARLPWANRPPIGTGLGLAICDGIIRAHGGRIWAESQLGEGSTFVFTLPIPAQPPTGSLPEVGRRAEPLAPSPQSDGRTDAGDAQTARSPGRSEANA